MGRYYISFTTALGYRCSLRAGDFGPEFRVEVSDAEGKNWNFAKGITRESREQLKAWFLKQLSKLNTTLGGVTEVSEEPKVELHEQAAEAVESEDSVA